MKNRGIKTGKVCDTPFCGVFSAYAGKVIHFYFTRFMELRSTNRS